MYGGSDKSIDQIVEEVRRTVIGQDAAVEWLAAFVDASCARTRLVKVEGVDTLDLPVMGSALIVGPTASGKSHLAKTFARAAGLIFRSIDASQMSAAGYKGATFSGEWAQLADALEQNPGSNALVLIDEVDKLLMQTEREGSARFDLLKPLEGGVLESAGSGMDHPGFSLDCDRCVFVLAGAFTGIEEVVARRLGQSRGSMGFLAPVSGADEASAREARLRAQMTLDDIEAWGAPRELVGRLSTVRFLSALGEDALRQIVRRNKVAEYARMLPGEARMTIDQDAEDLLVQRALAANYGARSINQQLNALFFGRLWRDVRSDGRPVSSLALTVRDGELDYDLAFDGGVRACCPDVDGLLARRAFTLLRQVHERVERWGGVAPFDPCESLGADVADYGAALLLAGGQAVVRGGRAYVREDFSLAEVVLLGALYDLLRDWFPQTDQAPGSLSTLLSMGSLTTGATSPLGLLFGQIETGRRYVRVDASGRPLDEGGVPADGEERWAWVDSQLVREGDGTRPATCGGLAPEQDRALGCYDEFRSYPEESRRAAMTGLAFRLLQVGVR